MLLNATLLQCLTASTHESTDQAAPINMILSKLWACRNTCRMATVLQLVLRRWVL